MRKRNTAFWLAIGLGCMTFLSGCSVTETMDKVIGTTVEEVPLEQEEQTEVIDKEEVKEVDSSVEQPVFTTNLEGNLTCGVNAEVPALQVAAEVSDGGTVTYQWYQNSTNSNGGGVRLEGATAAEYTPDVSAEGTSYYYVVATNTVDGKINMTTSNTMEVTVREGEQTYLNGELVGAGWVKNDRGWWYQKADGTYPANCWMEIDGQWYLFDQDGYMQTGWKQVDGGWYYLNEDGSMAANTTIDGYVLDASGRMIE